MGTRLQLQSKLEDITGMAKVYFQKPSDDRMQYPCIVYNRSGSGTMHANNKTYNITKEYNLIFIDSDPDNLIADILESLPMCTLDNAYSTNGLHHYVYTLFY